MLDPITKGALAELGNATSAKSSGERPAWVDGEWQPSRRSSLILPPDRYVIVPSNSRRSPDVPRTGRLADSYFEKNPIALRAIEARKAGDFRRAERLFRLAFARGERTPEVVEAIERMTDHVISSGLGVVIFEGVDGPEEFKEFSLRDVASVRRFFEERVGSNITLMDVAEVMDIFSPLFPLKRVAIHYDEREDTSRSEIAVEGVYDGVEEDEIVFQVTFNAEDGRAQIVHTSIDAGPFTRLGFGVRSLLSRSTFLRRHGLESWSDIITDDGLLVWPRFGAIVEDESIPVASAMLECLNMLGATEVFKDVSSTMDITELASLKLNAEDVLDFGALLNWVDIYADVPEEELEILHPPYRVGMMALESVGVSGYFHVGTTLYRMLWEYMPDRFMRMASGGAPEHERPTSILADIGLFMAYQNALAESDAIDAAEATVVEARAEAMERTESFKGIIRSSGVDGLLLRPEDELGLGLPSPDRFYAGSAFEAGELLIASGLFAVPKVRIA